MHNYIDLTKEEKKANYQARFLEIKENKKKYDNYKLVVFDTETYGLVPENLALAIFFDGLNYIICYTKKEVDEYLDSIKENTLIYAHNGFGFDYNIFIEDILIQKMKFDQKGGVKFLKYINVNSVEIVFRDSLYILPSSLNDLGKSFTKGNYKGVTPQKFINPSKHGFNRVEFEKDRRAYNIKNLTMEDVEYCKQDCLVLYEILNNEEVLKLDYKNFNTIAKIANHKMLSSIDSIMLSNYIDFKFKNLYSGGLTSVFKHEAKGKIGTYDVNSMYPFAMTQAFANPMSLNEYYYKNATLEILNQWFTMLKEFPNGKSVLTLRLKENTPSNIIEILKTIPLIPNYKTIYYDLFDYKQYKIEVMNVELANLLDERLFKYLEITPIYSIYANKENLIYPFKNFIEFHYDERVKHKKERPAYAQILKLIMNSSYGYFAMQNENSQYFYGSELEIAFKIENLIKEKGFDVISYQEFVKEHQRKAIIIETPDGFQYDEVGIYEYFYFAQELLGDFEELQFKTLNEVCLENKDIKNLYIMYFSSEKYINPTKTSFYIASEITSKSRAYLGKIALDVAFSNNNICYTDTDSLHIEILNEKALNKALEKYIDNNKIGMLKHEGDFEYALWFSKKHYYLFNEINNKLVLTKDALKGFGAQIPLDKIIYEQDIVNVSKMASRIKNVTFETNNLSKSKNFLNFVVSRKRDGTFYNIEDDSRRDALIHKKELKELYFRILDSNLYVTNEFIKNDNIEEIKRLIKEFGLTKITKQRVENRIKEISQYFVNNTREGVYDSLSVLKLLPKEEEKELVRNILKIKGNYRNTKKIKIDKEEIRANKKRTRKKINNEYYLKKKEEKQNQKNLITNRLVGIGQRKG